VEHQDKEILEQLIHQVYLDTYKGNIQEQEEAELQQLDLEMQQEDHLQIMLLVVMEEQDLQIVFQDHQ
jgi:hypothetical protein